VRRLASVAVVIATAALAAPSTPARAEEPVGGPQPAPSFGENPSRTYESSQRFAFELKFGPYSPNIDASPGLNGKTPFADLFPPAAGKTRPPGKLLTSIEFDWQFFRRAYGNFGIGHTVGFYRRTTHSFNFTTVDGNNTTPCSTTDPNNPCMRSGDQTALNIIPMSILAVYRFDYLARRWRIPFVPYFKIGLAYYFWWIENGNGSIAQFTPPGSTQSQGGWGGTFGWVMNPGGAFMLDVLDPTAAKIIDAELGINHTYLFCEFAYNKIDGFGAANKMNLSDTTLNAGLAFEF
jgi:hypothetical protein